jgi:hypothetical protein
MAEKRAGNPQLTHCARLRTALSKPRSIVQRALRSDNCTEHLHSKLSARPQLYQPKVHLCVTEGIESSNDIDFKYSSIAGQEFIPC